MNAASVNIHYHGTNTPPTCHQDEVITTLVNSGQSFQYDVHFPEDEPPGLYWYHPHVHGISEAAVLGGASGAIVVEGIENVNPAVAGLPERVMIIRDNLVPGNPTPGGNVPSWDISLNYTPVAYPNFTPVVVPISRAKAVLARRQRFGRYHPGHSASVRWSAATPASHRPRWRSHRLSGWSVKGQDGDTDRYLPRARRAR